MKIKRIIKKNIGLIMAIISAFLYAFNVIIEKKYIYDISSDMILFLMYLGGGAGLFIIYLCTKNNKTNKSNKITKKEVPKIIYIIVCELIASSLLIEAVKVVDASLVSLLSVFEIIMTAICAYILFKEPIKKNEIISMILMITGFILLNYRARIFSDIRISSLLVILSCLFWGLENNITAQISSKEPAFFTGIKCFSVAILYLLIVLFKGTFNFSFPILIVFGFFTYGLSILTYAISTRYLGANKATIVFSFSPIFGVILALLIYKEKITETFVISIILMICAILCLNIDSKKEE